jgi:hypothetical protein
MSKPAPRATGGARTVMAVAISARCSAPSSVVGHVVCLGTPCHLDIELPDLLLG